MKEGAVVILFFLICRFSNPVSAQQPSNGNQAQPKVVIGIVVENMRPDYIQRYWNKFQSNGFKKLYTQGAVCSNVNITQHIQSYASGTATLFTGVNPSIHGIIDKTWYDRMKKKELDCTE
jgi:predicted AlkP superfamily pyrophosphatase or phosphodiesterase